MGGRHIASRLNGILLFTCAPMALESGCYGVTIVHDQMLILMSYDQICLSDPTSMGSTGTEGL